jgi:hypothetical protein
MYWRYRIIVVAEVALMKLSYADIPAWLALLSVYFDWIHTWELYRLPLCTHSTSNESR